MSNQQNKGRQGSVSYPEYHPLVDGWRACYGDEEVYSFRTIANY